MPEVAFVGGCTTILLIDSSAYFGVRQTQDVDVIIDVTRYLGYQLLSGKLKKAEFVEDVDGPNCRWRWRGRWPVIKLDVMPIDEAALGFSNEWCPDAIKNAEIH